MLLCRYLSIHIQLGFYGPVLFTTMVEGCLGGSRFVNVKSLCSSLFLAFLIVIHLCRLITAADSDDVSSAIQFLSRTRPWSTFMAVGWGFGANMLTKYLAEVGEKTPLTAATCIDNPFDLEEFTRASDSRAAFNQKLTGGLIDILKSNKVRNLLKYLFLCNGYEFVNSLSCNL